MTEFVNFGRTKKMVDKYIKSVNDIDSYAVVGNPIAHSKSPIIHAEFARQTNQNISYEPILAPLDGFEATVRDLIAKGYKGANVTVPFKIEAFNIANRQSIRASAAGAANTLIFKSGDIVIDNTDGIGLINDLQNNLAMSLGGKRILLLGAGGAARGVLFPLLIAQPTQVVIANRNLHKARELVENMAETEVFKGISIPLITSSYRDLNGEYFDVIINATSAGLTGSELPIPDTIFAKNCLAYEMMYGRETPFMVQARGAGAQVADGLGMLVEQAAEAFYSWRGVRPETAPVIEMLRKS